MYFLVHFLSAIFSDVGDSAKKYKMAIFNFKSKPSTFFGFFYLVPN